MLVFSEMGIALMLCNLICSDWILSQSLFLATYQESFSCLFSSFSIWEHSSTPAIMLAVIIGNTVIVCPSLLTLLVYVLQELVELYSD